MNDAYTQQALANDARFRLRVKDALAAIAWQVLDENPAAANHPARAAYARTVIGNLDGAVAQVAGWLVNRTNLFSANTTVALVQGVPVVQTDATDAAIRSQLATDWDKAAGVV